MRLLGQVFVLLLVLAAGFGLGVLASAWDDDWLRTQDEGA